MTDDLNGYQWWQEEIMLLWARRESNVNIDYKMVITGISFSDEIKYFS